MKILTALIVPALLFSNMARSQETPASLAAAAAQQLNAASFALQDANRARDRVAALTRTIQAYENGLVAMREGIRRAAIRHRSLQLELETRRAEIAGLLTALQAIQKAPAPLRLVHPSGPTGTARAGMIVSRITPALQEQAKSLDAQLDEIAVLQNLQQGSARILADGLVEVQLARSNLSAAISDRTTLPRKFTANPDNLLLLLNSAETLDGFASGLASVVEDGEIDVALPSFGFAKGTLRLPVSGIIIRHFNEADAAGIRRPGLLVAAQPLSIVTTPWPATIRYLGPLLDYGNVMILEPSNGYLLVFAGLNRVYGEIGDVLPTGSPVGLMGGTAPKQGEFSSLATEGTGVLHTESLYLELRYRQKPVDPEEWFALNKE
jgi:septal ring factor EnvC (AmiA/AmiB activator)